MYSYREKKTKNFSVQKYFREMKKSKTYGRPNEMSTKLKTEYFKIPHGIKASYQINDSQLNIVQITKVFLKKIAHSHLLK